MRNCATTLAPETTQEEASYLQDILRSMHFSGKHLEIGTAAGGTLCLLMKVFDDKERPPFIVVDPMTYFKGQMDTVKKNLRQHGLPESDVEFRIKKSSEAFRESSEKGEVFDFIFIDASHKIHRVTEDLRWTRLLREGGVVCLHDYYTEKGVTMALNRFIRKHANYAVVGQVGSLIAFKKTDKSTEREVSLLDRLWSRSVGLVLQTEKSLSKRLRKTACIRK